MSHARLTSAASAALALALVLAPPAAGAQPAALAHASHAAPAATTWYGTGIQLGEGRARPYVVMDAAGAAPVEIGVAFDERAMEGLPKSGSGHHGAHGPVHSFVLELPAHVTAPFRFIELNWNPSGHEPDGVYEGVPHFDFHFYTITPAERDAIVPSDPHYAAKANDVPTGDLVPPFNAALGPPGVPPAGLAVPRMGVHWVDVRSAELQALLGKPEAYQPFTATFIHGSWAGRFIFWEPMVTRAHILAKRTATDPAVRDQLIPIPTPARYAASGHYPTAYRIAWDPRAREYRVALTNLARQP